MPTVNALIKTIIKTIIYLLYTRYVGIIKHFRNVFRFYSWKYKI